MEPLTTLALVAAFIAPVPATRRPEWTSATRALESTGPALDTDRPLLAMAASTEWILLPPASTIRPDRKVALSAEIDSYQRLRDGWNEEGSVAPTELSGAAAIRFIDSFPAGLPLPRPMVSSKGHLGFFWDLENGYADLSFDSEGVGSFFSRSKDGTEQYFADLAQAAMTRQWFFEMLGELSAPAVEAA